MHVRGAHKSDSAQAAAVLAQAKGRFAELEHVVADGGYRRQAHNAAEQLGMSMQALKKRKAKRAFRSCPGAG